MGNPEPHPSFLTLNKFSVISNTFTILFISIFHLNQFYPRTPSQVMNAIIVATITAKAVNAGIARPSIVILVKVAKSPDAGVKPPYIQDWKAAARDPNFSVSIRYVLGS